MARGEGGRRVGARARAGARSLLLKMEVEALARNGGYLSALDANDGAFVEHGAHGEPPRERVHQRGGKPGTSPPPSRAESAWGVMK